MPRVRLFTAVATVLAVLLSAAAVHAQSGTPAISADKAYYTRQLDHVATLTASGLTACSGKAVQFGLFVSPSDVRSDLVTASIDAAGHAVAEVPLPVNSTAQLYPGITGAPCIPGGTLLSNETVTVFELDPKPTYLHMSSALRQAGVDHNGGYVDVYANGALCGRLSFTDPKQQTVNGEGLFALAQASQPPACGTDGATITLVDGNGRHLVETYTLKLGTQIEIVHLSIPAPIDPGPLPPNAGSGVAEGGRSQWPAVAAVALVAVGVAAGSAAVCNRRSRR